MEREQELKEAAVKQADKWYGNTPGELSKNIFKRGVEWGAQWEADRNAKHISNLENALKIAVENLKAVTKKT